MKQIGYIRVPAAGKEETVLLSKKVYRSNNPISALEYMHQYNPPTLSELLRAPKEELMKTLERGTGEWTRTIRMLRPRARGEVVPKGYKPVKIVELPCFRSSGGNLKSTDLLEPPRGYVRRIENGYPLETADEKEKALGPYASYFLPHPENGDIRILARYTSEKYGPFFICALYGPEKTSPDIGARKSHYDDSFLDRLIMKLK